jgi:hypothetical protein
MQKTSLFSELLARNIKEIDEYDAKERLGPQIPSEYDRTRLELFVSYLHSAEPFVQEMSDTRKTYFELLVKISVDTLHHPPSPSVMEQFEKMFPLGSQVKLLATQLVIETNIRDVNNLVLFALYFTTLEAIRPFFDAVSYIYPRDIDEEGVLEIWQYLLYMLSVGDVGDGVSGERRKEAVRITGLLAGFVKGEDPEVGGESADRTVAEEEEVEPHFRNLESKFSEILL